MKKNILVLGLSIASLGAFAQGLGDVKNAAKEAQKIKVEVVEEEVSKSKFAEDQDLTKAVKTVKVDELVEKAEKIVGVDAGTVTKAKDAVAEVAGDAIKDAANDKVEEIKEAAENQIEAVNSTKDEVLATATDKSEASADELGAKVEQKETLKEEKKTALLANIATLSSKITAAESKLEILKKSGISPEELVEKTAIIDGAKAKLASLTAAYL